MESAHLILASTGIEPPTTASPTHLPNISPPRPTLAMHMANARRMYQTRAPNTQSRRRSNTVSPKPNANLTALSGSTSDPTPPHADNRFASDSDSASSKVFVNTATEIPTGYCEEYIRKNKRLSEVSRRMDELKRRTTSRVAEIEQITSSCNNELAATAAITASSTGAIPKTFIATSEPPSAVSFAPNGSSTRERSTTDLTPVEVSASLVSTGAVKKERISNDSLNDCDEYLAESTGFYLPNPCDTTNYSPLASSIRSSNQPSNLRRKSSEESNSIVSILKKGEFSPGGAAEPHSILKKKDHSTPSDSTFTKHVSISEAVILAAAELYKDTPAFSPSSSIDSEIVIRPILKQDTFTASTIRPILKKKFSLETEEIRPILKGSRKSSREESDNDTDSYRSCLRQDSPARRRPSVDPFKSNIVLERSRSYEVDTQNHATISTPPAQDGRRFSVMEPLTQPLFIEKPLISVAERIKHMERALRDADSSPNVVPAAESARRQRFKTQPVTVDEIYW